MIFALTIVFFISGADPQEASGLFDNRTNCEIAEQEVLTAASKDTKVLGFAVVDECKPVAMTNGI